MFGITKLSKEEQEVRNKAIVKAKVKQEIIDCTSKVAELRIKQAKLQEELEGL